MEDTDEVVEFINRRFPKNLDCNWTNGNCYYFAVILQARFSPIGEIFYDVIDCHFLFRYREKFYDATGRVHPEHPEKLISWDNFDAYDRMQKGRIIQDCIL